MLGLDLGQHAFYAVEVKGNRVVGYGSCATPPEAFQGNVVVAPLRAAEAIQRLVLALRVSETRVHLSIGGQGMINKWVELPTVSWEELERATPYEAPRHLPPTKEPMLYRFWIPPESLEGEGETILARLIAVPQAMVDSRLEAVALAGLEPVSVEPEADAVVRVLTRDHASKSTLWRGKATAILNLRYGYTEMTIARETRLEFTRTLGMGLNDLLELLARSVGADWQEAEALLQVGTINETGTFQFPEEVGLPPIPLLPFLYGVTSEMRRMIDFQRSRFPEGSYLGLLDTFVITGEGALLQGLAPYCSQSLGVTCVLGNLLGSFEWHQPEAFEKLNPYVVALGSAMEGSVHQHQEPSSVRAERVVAA